MTKGDRVRYVGGGWFTPVGTLGTYEGGADYVPGLDAGCFTVRYDEPNEVGHLASAHWTYGEVCDCWEVVK